MEPFAISPPAGVKFAIYSRSVAPAASMPPLPVISKPVNVDPLALDPPLIVVP